MSLDLKYEVVLRTIQYKSCDACMHAYNGRVHTKGGVGVMISGLNCGESNYA